MSYRKLGVKDIRTLPTKRLRHTDDDAFDASDPKIALYSKSSDRLRVLREGLVICVAGVKGEPRVAEGGTEKDWGRGKGFGAETEWGLSKSGGSRSRRTSSILVCHE